MITKKYRGGEGVEYLSIGTCSMKHDKECKNEFHHISIHKKLTQATIDGKSLFSCCFAICSFVL